MVSTRETKQSKRRLLSQLDDFDESFFGDAAKSGRQDVVGNNTGDQAFFVNNNGSNLTANENAMDVQTLERCFSEWTDREMGNIVDTVENTIQNAILAAIDQGLI